MIYENDLHSIINIKKYNYFLAQNWLNKKIERPLIDDYKNLGKKM